MVSIILGFCTACSEFICWFCGFHFIFMHHFLTTTYFVLIQWGKFNLALHFIKQFSWNTKIWVWTGVTSSMLSHNFLNGLLCCQREYWKDNTPHKKNPTASISERADCEKLFNFTLVALVIYQQLVRHWPQDLQSEAFPIFFIWIVDRMDKIALLSFSWSNIC